MGVLLRVMSAARKTTLAEWYALDEDDPRELARGVLEEAEVPERIHELVVAWLVVLLRPWAMRRGAVRRDTGCMPDVVAAGRDRLAKSADHAAFGVEQYWLVDPRLRTFEIFQLDPKRRYVRVAAAAAGKLRRIPRLPGLVIDVDALWAQIDRLEE